jgi:hypothetical protein
VFEVYELESGGPYRRALGAADGTVDTVPGCAGLSLNLDELWSEVALLENESRVPSGLPDEHVELPGRYSAPLRP